jgi:hypothetical protein
VRKTVALLGVLGVFVFGVAGAVALGETTTVSACATATTPAHTVGVDGVDVTTIPGDTATNCVTSTLPLATVTNTVTQTITQTVTSTVSTTTPAAPLFNGNFETGNFSQFNSTYVPNASYSQSVVAAPGGHSGMAGRFETKANDSGPLGTSAVWDQVQVNSSEHIGDESFWHAEVYLPADFTDSASFWQDMFEWHDFSTVGDGLCRCSGSPPLTVQEIKGRYVVRIVNDANEANGSNWTQYDLGPATRGAWSSFDFHFKWSDNPAVALTEITVNGTKTTITGHPNEFTGYFNYFLAGWYHGVVSAPATQVLYLDNVRRCSALCP